MKSYTKQKSRKKVRKLKSKKSRKKKSKKLSPTERKCKKYLQKKIKINMEEWKKGRFVSQKQALAVSYSQTKKKYTSCKKIMRKRKK